MKTVTKVFGCCTVVNTIAFVCSQKSRKIVIYYGNYI